jgi:2-oxoglutarate ferredoxin oxidoreductase subunit delta
LNIAKLIFFSKEIDKIEKFHIGKAHKIPNRGLDHIMAKKKRTGNIVIDEELCKGCYLCISVCPNKVITISEKLNHQGYYPAEANNDNNEGNNCTGCAMCATICPDVAIEVYRD